MKAAKEKLTHYVQKDNDAAIQLLRGIIKIQKKNNACKQWTDIFFLIFIYLSMRERQRHRQREKQAAHREPHAGPDPPSQDQALSQRQAPNS